MTNLHVLARRVNYVDLSAKVAGALIGSVAGSIVGFELFLLLAH